MKKPAALPPIVCSSPADVDWSMVSSGREMTPFSAFLVVVVVVVVLSPQIYFYLKSRCRMKKSFRIIGSVSGPYISKI